MKKTIITLILILVAVYAVLSILGMGSEYAAERLFYRAMKANEKIVINPDVAPPKLLSFVEKNLQKILENYPNSNMAKAASIALSEFYISRKKYDEVISVLDDIIKKEGQDESMLSKAHFFKGAAYEKQDKWDKALEEYTLLRDKYSHTAIGLQIPIYIGRYYEVKGKQPEADKAYNEAVIFYEKLKEENKGKMLGYTASSFLREAYISLREFEEAGKVVESTIRDYPYELTFNQQAPYVELLFVDTLKRPEKAVEIYKFIKEKTTNERLRQASQRAIERLESQQQPQ